MIGVLGRRTILYSTSSLFKIFVTLGTLPLMTKILNAEDYGVIALVTITANAFGTLSTIGSTLIMSKEYHGKSQAQRTQFISSYIFLIFIMGILLSLCFYFVWPFLSGLISTEAVQLSNLAIFCVGFSIFSAGWGPLISESLVLDGRAKTFALFMSLRELAGAITVIFCLYALNLKLDSVFIGLVTISIFDIIFGLFISRIYLAFRVDRKCVRSILSEINVCLVQFLDIGGRLFERSIVSHSVGLGTLGIVSHAHSYEVSLKAVVKSVTRATWPENLREAKAKTQSFSLARMTIIIVTALCLTSAIGMATLGYDVVSFLTNGKMGDAAYLAAALMISISINLSAIPERSVLYSLGKTNEIAFVNLFSRMFFIAVLLLFMQSLGVYALVGASLGSAVLSRLITYYFASRFCQLEFPSLSFFVSISIGYSCLVTSYLFAMDILDRALLFFLFCSIVFIIFLPLLLRYARKVT